MAFGTIPRTDLLDGGLYIAAKTSSSEHRGMEG